MLDSAFIFILSPSHPHCNKYKCACVCVCVCSCAHVGYVYITCVPLHMCVETNKHWVFSSTTVQFFIWDSVSQWTWGPLIGYIWQASYRSPPVSASSNGITGMHHDVWPFTCVPEIWTQVLTLGRQGFCQWSHLSSSSSSLWLLFIVQRTKKKLCKPF